MSVAFLYPGQGSQRPGMLGRLPDHPSVRRVLEEADRHLEGGVGRLNDPAALRSTVAAQLCLLVAGVATAAALDEEGAAPDVVAGHSVGAFGAAVAAGSLTFPEALAAVRLRATLMERAYPAGYGMAAVLGATPGAVRRLVETVSIPEEPLYVANVNAPDQVVVSGSAAALENLAAAAPGAGARSVERLDVAVPSHCPLMRPVADELAEHLRGVPRRALAAPYLSNAGGRVLRDAAAVLGDLSESLATPVRWHDATTLMVELGADLFAQLPPGRVLADLAEREHPGVRTVAVADAGLRDAAFLVRRARGR